MHAKLFRSLDYPDLRWHAIGPSDHCRAAFNLIDLVGFAPVKQRTREEQDRIRDWSGGPPYKIYSPYKWIGSDPDPDKRYSTVAAAKRAARAFVMSWLKSASEGPLIWETSETGCHFHAMVSDGPHIGHIYYCTEEGKGLKPGFRVWFGGTYYVVDFANPEEARAAVQQTWLEWLSIARHRFLSQNVEATHGGTPLSPLSCSLFSFLLPFVPHRFRCRSKRFSSQEKMLRRFLAFHLVQIFGF